MFVGDFNSKLEAFGCTSKNTSGPMLKTIQNKLNLIYVNNNEHTHMDRRTGSTDILDMAFISQNLAIHDIQFQIGVDLGSDHLPIEISVDTTPLRNTSTNHTKYKFDQTDREVFESVLEEALGSVDFSGHLSTSDLDRYADFIITALHTVVDKAIPKSKSVRPESNPISNETLALIKEKRTLRRQYSQRKDPAVKTRINQLQKQVKDALRTESQAPKYILPKLLHDSTGLPYVKDCLLSCATKSLDRIAQNPLVEATISSNRLNPAWDRFPTPLSVIHPGRFLV